MAQGTWVSYTAPLELTRAPSAPAQRRAWPRLASRLRWGAAALCLVALSPALGALSTGEAVGPPSPAPSLVAGVAAQGRNLLSSTGYQITMPLAVTKVTPPPPPQPSLPYGNAFWQPVPEPPIGTIKQIIWAAAQKYNVSYAWLLGVAECESGLDPTDVNRSSGASGLFQFMPATFYGHGGTDIWNPTQQANIAAKMFSIGESSEWVCK